jgi:hypothetical protein
MSTGAVTSILSAIRSEKAGRPLIVTGYSRVIVRNDYVSEGGLPLRRHR